MKTLQRALRTAPDGLPTVSAQTIWRVLHDSGITWQRGRSWCETDKVGEKCESRFAVVIDPYTSAKKAD